MRRLAQRIVIAAVAAGLGLGIWPSSPAVAATDDPLDFGPVFMLAAPDGYPRDFFGYYVRPDATKWGWNEQVLPIGLADGRGQNTASAAIAPNCFPATGEEPKDQLLAYNKALLEGACRLHPGSVTFNVGTAHRGRNRDGNTFSTQARNYFIRYSRTSDCQSPTVNGDGAEVVPDMTGYGLRMDVVRGIGDQNTQITRQIPVDKVGQYLCIVQGHIGTQFVESRIPILGVDEAFAWRVRGPWTAFKIVAAGESDKPTDVTAAAGNAEALIRWNYTERDLAATTFTATSSPDGKSCWVLGAKSCLITGLRNGVAYTFTVRAERGAVRAESAPTAAVTPRDPNAPAGAGAGAAQPLAAARPIVLPVNGNVVQPLGMVEVTAGMSGAPAAGQRITGRTVLACFVAARGAACGNERRVIQLNPTVELQRVRVWIPSAAAGKFLRVSQNVSTSTGQIGSPVVYSAISRDAAIGPNRVDPPAGADPNANAPAQAGDVAAIPADAAAAAAPAADAGAAAPAADAGAAAAAAPAPGDAAGAAGGVDPAQAARAAGIDLAARPIAAATGPSMQLAASSKVNRGRFITMKAVVSPKATGGRVRIALVRMTPKGKYVSSKSIYAPVVKGVATKRWRIPTSYTPSAFTLVASYEPKGGGVGATTTVPVTIG